MKIYGVQGSCGSYEDYYTYVVITYLDKKLADKHCILANEYSDAWNLEVKFNKLDKYDIPDNYNPYDKDMSSDYYGASTYEIIEMKIGDEDSFKNLDNYLLDIV